MKKTIIILCCIIFSALIISCTDSTENASNKITGRVIAANGSPVENAELILSYNITNEYYRPMWSIYFMIANQQHVRLWVTEAGKADTIRLLLDEEMTEGAHEVAWDGKNTDGDVVLNGFYEFKLEISNEVHSMLILVNNEYFSDENNYLFNAQTDEDGRFGIEQDNLPFNSSYNSTDIYDEMGNVIGTAHVNRYVTIWAMHPDYGLAGYVDSVYVEESSPTEVEIWVEE